MSDRFERAPIAQAPLSVVLPAYNVAGQVEKVLGGWVAYLDTLSRDYELLFVNDGSTDGTAALVTAWAASCPRLRLLEHADFQGPGAALRTGIATARHPLLCTGVCSLAYWPEDLGRMLELIDQVDLVSGLRVRSTGREERLRAPLLMRSWLRLLYGLRLQDIDCPFKLFRRAIFRRIPIQSQGPFVQAEILAKANFLGSIMTEAAVRYAAERGPDNPLPTLAAWRKDARRLFFAPDFGPTVLPEEPSGPVP